MYSIESDTRVVGLQLPSQARIPYIMSPWEAEAGPDEMRRIAQVCDQSGFAYLGVCDHVAIPRPINERMGSHWTDPISMLGWLAGITTNIKLLTHVLVLGYRHPLLAAKQLSTIDYLSNGRLIAGIGGGHLEAEFDLLGVEFARRGPKLDDDLDLLSKTLETGTVTDTDGTEFLVEPRSTSLPRPPLWIAGSSPAARRRATTIGDGWLPQGPAGSNDVDDLLRRLEINNRDPSTFAIGHIAPTVFVGKPSGDVGPNTIVGSPEDVAEKLIAGAPAEVNQFQIRVAANSIDEACDQLAQFGADVLPLMANK